MINNKGQRIVYIRTTKDKYKLIIALTETLDEMERITGIKKSSIMSMISHRVGGFERVVIE